MREISLPSDQQLEREIIGGLFCEDYAPLANARSVISEDHFSLELHRRVWRSLCRIMDAGSVLTPLAVHADMSARNEQISLSELLDLRADTYWAADKYLEQLSNLTKRRRLVVRGMQLASDAADRTIPVDQIAASAAAGIQQDVEGGSMDQPEQAGEIIEAAGGLASFLAPAVGIPTPWPALNYVTGGWQPGELIIIAARPSMGKTAFALNAAYDGALRNQAPVFYSFEMSQDSLLKRLLCMRTGMTYRQIQSGEFSPSERRALVEATNALSALPLRIVSAAGRGVLAIRSHAERLHRRSKCGMVFVDYLGLVRAADAEENRNRQLGQMARELKNMALDLQLPAMVLAQLNRGTETRNDKRPMMSDLRDSGEIEEHADFLGLLHRPGYYDRNNADIQLAAELIIGKQRNGDTPVIPLEFHRQSGRFVDPAAAQPQDERLFA